MNSILLLLFLASPGPAAPAPAPTPTDSKASSDCVVKLTATGFMQFGLDDNGKSQPFPDRIIKLPKKCLKETTTFHLRYDGQGKKVAMGHNLVISEDGDVQKILDQSRNAKFESDFLDEGESTKKLIVGKSKMLGENEADSFTVPANSFKEGRDYAFFCSFPGHAGLMKGKVQFVESSKS